MDRTVMRASGDAAGRAAQRLIGEPPAVELDSIDLAYLYLERPVLVCRVDRTVSKAGRRVFLEQLRLLTNHAILMLPPGYSVELITPDGSNIADLPRWADDGGKV